MRLRIFGCPSRREVLAAGGTLALLPLLSEFPALAQTPADTKIGVIGSGRLGGPVGTIFAKAGYKVMFSSRHPEELKDLVARAGPNASAGTVQEAVAFGNVILIAVPYKALPEVGKD
jgi:lactate dehydrogenase-like 2-hydroxyacid dehydrogenase